MSDTITLRQWVTMDGHGCVEMWNDDSKPALHGHSWMSREGDPSGLGGHLRDQFVAAMGLTPGDCIPVDVTLTVKRREARFVVLDEPHSCVHVKDTARNSSTTQAVVGTFLPEFREHAERFCADLNAASEARKGV